MEIKNFCDAHWLSEPHGAEPMRPDAGDRMRIYPPEAEMCSFCLERATHTAGPEGTPAFEAEPTPRGHLPDHER